MITYTAPICSEWLISLYISLRFNTNFLKTFNFEHCQQLHTPNQTRSPKKTYCIIKALLANVPMIFCIIYTSMWSQNVLCVPYLGELRRYDGAIQDEYEGILDTWPMVASFEFQHFIYALNIQFTFTNITNTKAKK